MTSDKQKINFSNAEHILNIVHNKMHVLRNKIYGGLQDKVT